MECRITPKLGVVIVAGGKGLRMGGEVPKQFMFLGQAPILAISINKFAESFSSAEIVVVLPADHKEYWLNLSSRFNVAKHKIADGGNERFHSVKAGIEALSPDVEVIAIHDGVRPLFSSAMLERLHEDVMRYGSAIPVTPVVDSFREVVEGQHSRIVDRSTLRAVQTPQLFDSITLRRAYNQQFSQQFTDDASVVEAMGESVHLSHGEAHNIKITTRLDLLYAEMIITENDGK